jgi:CBS domain-containing protein
MTRLATPFAVLGSLLALAGPARAQPEVVNLRPVDRATVRIISLRGVAASATRGERTRTRRVVGQPLATHGSGVVVGPRLVLTARHVIWGAEAWAVVLPASSEPRAALPVYVDPEHDVAFLVVDGTLPERLALPGDARTLTLSEEVSASGYPLDLREYTPAAVSGQVSRVTRRGQLQLSMTVNPGHSGGPVIDARGRLVGIISARGRLDRGVEGLAIAVPLPIIRAAHERIPEAAPAFTQEHRDIAAGIGWVTGVGDDELLEHREAVQRVLQRASTWTTVDADRDAVLAALAWNLLVKYLEARSAEAVSDVAADERPAAELLHRVATQLARRALRTGPHVRRRFPVLRAISIGRVVPHAPSRADGRATR